MTYSNIKFFVFISLAFSLISYSQVKQNLWNPSQNQVLENDSVKNPNLDQEHVAFFELDKQVLKNDLKKLNHKDNIELLFPVVKGDFIRFSVQESSILPPGLAQKYPQIKTYKGVGLDDSRATIRFTVSQLGFDAIYHDGNNKTFYIKSETNDLDIIKVYDRQYYGKTALNLDCLTNESVNELAFENQSVKQTSSDAGTLVQDSKLRIFKLALSCTGEYSNLFKGSGTVEDQKGNVLAEMTNAINRVNEIYERDLGIRLVFVENMDQVIYLDATTDPWQGEYNTKTAETLDAVIGVNNYDIGHNFNTTNGGAAGCIGCVCKETSQSSVHKGRGFTGLPNPTGDPFYIDYVCHEMGHQFGAYHTMNKCDRAGQFTGSEVEPGSGSSIMGYAGICDPNVQVNSDAHFNYVSIKQIADYVINESGASCAQEKSILNQAPVANAGLDYTIPTNTPFVLTGSASDADGMSSLTYNWSQNDALFPPGTSSPESHWESGAMYRSILPSTSPVRYMPKLDQVVNGKIRTTWEVTPSVGRTLNFAFTVRDNGSGYSGDDGVGQVDADLMQVTVVDTGSAFEVTSQSDRESWDVGDLRTVTWQVAGTDSNGINVSQVDILMSTNDGESFDVVLAENVPNTGSYDVTVPDLKGFGYKIMVKAVGNIFYAVNQGFVEIGYFVNRSCFTYENSPALSIPDNTDNYAVESVVNVGTHTGKLVDVNLTVNITHTYIADLEIALVNPEGVVVELMKRRDCSSQDNVKVIFDHEGEPFDCSNTNTFSYYNSFKDAISSFYDKPSQGEWTLKVGDHGPGDLGEINSWSLDLCYEEVELSEATHSIVDFEVYPNPAQTILFIKSNSKLDKNSQVQIYDVNGRLILKQDTLINANKIVSLNVDQFKRGVYFMRVSNGNLVKTKRIILN